MGPDDRIAMALYRRLSDLGHDVFLNSERVRLGTQWPREIRGALDRAEHVVALVSLAYLDSRHCVDEELVVAVRRRTPIIPVHLAHAGAYPESVRRDDRDPGVPVASTPTTSACSPRSLRAG